MRVEIYSDIVCPWCYIGERRLGRALMEYAGAGEVEAVFRPYRLDPEAPDHPVPLRSYLASRYGAQAAGMLVRVSEAAVGEGITIDWDRALAVDTMNAHRLMRLAEREYGAGTPRALAVRLFDAHFCRGIDIADAAALTRLATRVGMDGGRARSYLDSGEGREEVESEIGVARNLGVRAVPTFVFDGRNAVQGAHPVATLVRAMEQVAAMSR